MLSLMNQKSASRDGILAVNERPDVLEAKRTLDEHRTKRDEAKSHLDQIELLLAPILEGSSTVKAHVDESTILRASAARPQAQLTYFETEARLKDSEREFQRVVQAETRNVTEERVDARRPLIKELFALLDVVVAKAAQIEDYDAETRRLGGVPPLAPVTELLSDTYRQNFVEASRSVLKKEGWL